jgi:PEP-CTERM motif
MALEESKSLSRIFKETSGFMNQTKKPWQHLLAGATSLTFIVLPSQFAQAANIGLLGTNSNTDLTSFLTSNGNTVVDLNATPNFTGLDTVILLRNSPTGAVSTDLRNFVLNGGRLITEFTGADWALDDTAGNLLNADVTGGATLLSNTLVTFTQAGIDAGLATGVNNPYGDGTRTQAFRTIPISNIGNGVDVLATKPSSNPAAIIGGASGLGSTLVIAYDWADTFGSANSDTQNLILNALNYTASTPSVPEPASVLGILAFGLTGLMASRKRS